MCETGTGMTVRCGLSSDVTSKDDTTKSCRDSGEFLIGILDLLKAILEATSTGTPAGWERIDVRHKVRAALSRTNADGSRGGAVAGRPIKSLPQHVDCTARENESNNMGLHGDASLQ